MTERRQSGDDALKVADVAERLLGQHVTAVPLTSAGRNSRIYRVTCATGERFALKLYPPISTETVDRRAAELKALTLLEEVGIKPVPRLIATDERSNCSVLSWIDGEPPDEVTPADLASAIAFLASVHAARHHSWASEQSRAVESCLSVRELRRQVEQRLHDLVAIEGEPDLSSFLEQTVRPTWQRSVGRAESRASQAGIQLDVDLPRCLQTLAPSDFGFHNALRLANGSLAFVDFEYFGWDDPVKLTADLLLHPATALEAWARDQLRSGLGAVYADDLRFDVRLATLLPLFAVRWTLIMLNEFMPRGWRRRVLAGEKDSWAAAKARQLERARAFLASSAMWLAAGC